MTKAENKHAINEVLFIDGTMVYWPNMGFGCPVIHTNMQQCDKNLHLMMSGGYRSGLCPYKFKHILNEVQI